ncbi:C-X-C motif chemokine 13 [Bubalus kerabau]|uniref:C-X-C motif chemokine 13 n=1 Tax=Bubalus bubalis TaxID=89462 RepID=UPI001D0FF5C1|nr:C-X-C motif chemokine 13 [Bubalus bubalis]XP_055444848.1 C-X-C motif chemokine 13 [Bubalus carabanensis]
MRFTPGALLLMLLAFSLSPVHGVLEANNTNLKCKCLRETVIFSSFNLIEKLQIIPRGRGCPNTEIIVWMKNKLVICLNPQAKQTKTLMKALSKHILSTSPAPVVKKRSA